MQQEITKRESETRQVPERTWQRPTYTIATDIIEVGKEIVVYADMPGVAEKDVNLTVEKNVLHIQAGITEVTTKGYTRAYAEYQVGDYERTFTLPEEVDRSRIEATMQGGVLRIILPKAEPEKARKITVKTS